MSEINDRRRWLLGELSLWQDDGLLSPDQANVLRDRYRVRDEAASVASPDGGGSLLVFTLQGLAAVMFALAVLLLIGFNWEAMPRTVKLAVVLAVVAGTHAGGLYLRRRTNAHALGEVVSFLGCLLYGAGIWLVAQAYHLQAHYPDGVWWWAVGVLPFALCLDSLLCHLLFVFLMALWCGLEVLGPPGFGLWWGVWPSAAYSLPLLALPGLAWAYRKGSPAGVALYVPLLTWWVLLQTIAWGTAGYTVLWVGFLGAALLILAEIHSPDDAMGIPFRLWGALLTAGALVPISSAYFWEYQIDRRYLFDPERWLAVAGVTEVLAGLLLLAALVAVVVRSRSSEGGGQAWGPLTLAVVLAALAAWAALAPPGVGGWLVPSIVGNLAMIALALHLIRIGTRDERVRPFAGGVAYFLLWAFVRYADLFHAAGGMLGAAALFALTAVALIVVAQFWGRASHKPQSRLARPIARPGPAWLDGAASWLGRRAPAVLVGTAVLQLLVLVGMIAVEAYPLWVGKTIALRVVPVDPRDIFRGDYVVLSYEVGRATNLDPELGRRLRDGSTQGKPVFVSLEPEADGTHWKAKSVSLRPPASGPYLRGKLSYDFRNPIEFGIEAYYVQEGAGLEWERLRNSRKLSAEVALTSWGRAKIRRLIAED